MLSRQGVDEHGFLLSFRRPRDVRGPVEHEPKYSLGGSTFSLTIFNASSERETMREEVARVLNRLPPRTVRPAGHPLPDRRRIFSQVHLLRDAPACMTKKLLPDFCKRRDCLRQIAVGFGRGGQHTSERRNTFIDRTRLRDRGVSSRCGFKHCRTTSDHEERDQERTIVAQHRGWPEKQHARSEQGKAGQDTRSVPKTPHQEGGRERHAEVSKEDGSLHKLRLNRSELKGVF